MPRLTYFALKKNGTRSEANDVKSARNKCAKAGMLPSLTANLTKHLLIEHKQISYLLIQEWPCLWKSNYVDGIDHYTRLENRHFRKFCCVHLYPLLPCAARARCPLGASEKWKVLDRRYNLICIIYYFPREFNFPIVSPNEEEVCKDKQKQATNAGFSLQTPSPPPLSQHTHNSIQAHANAILMTTTRC